MKTNKLIALIVTAVVMTCTTAEAQRTSGRDNGNSPRTESRSNGGGNVRTGGGGGVRSSSNSQSRPSQVSRPQNSGNNRQGFAPSNNSQPRTVTRPSESQNRSQQSRPQMNNSRPQQQNRPQVNNSRPQQQNRPQVNNSRPQQQPARPQQNVRPQNNPSRPQAAQRPAQPARNDGPRPAAPLQLGNKKVALPGSPADRKPANPRLGPTPAHRNEGSFRTRQQPRPHEFSRLHPARPMDRPHIVNGHRYFHAVPPEAHRFDHHGNRFYVNCGNFYKWHATLGYELVARPLGMFFSMLPFACVKVYVNSTPYWYGDGVWFTKQNGGYVIINRPLAATAEVFLTSLPFSCKKVVIDGTTYYSGENNLFLPVDGGYVLVDNDDSYDIVEEDGNVNLTNFVSELPSGSKRVIVNGKLYWYGGETWFEPVNGGYVVVDEPYK